MTDKAAAAALWGDLTRDTRDTGTSSDMISYGNSRSLAPGEPNRSYGPTQFRYFPHEARSAYAST
jgi:hypothetical protein